MQSTKALLELCVLSLLAKGDAYGYKITEHIKKHLGLTGFSLNPIMERLMESKYLVSYDKLFNGRNRRYYSLTAKGKELLANYNNDWQNFKEKLDNFITKKEF
ncbi:MAG: PadR family transcriptional regulator [Defluviitaleaceae bacterium]|nr:PadR family transcriptional regulator [Defluviitaleaceae bacterium]